jgi:hypothetical protein
MAQLISEEDVKSKLLVPWLRDRGFAIENLQFEFSFVVRFGRSLFVVENGKLTRKSGSAASSDMVRQAQYRGRADILVRNDAGQNLFIVEVKRPGEKLDKDTRDQAISYATLLESNIAPLVIVTNGDETKVYDTITRAEVDHESVHPERCMRPVSLGTSDDVALRAEALESILSLSSENMLEFCAAQVQHRMSRLRGEDINSSKKYIPQLYVQRQTQKEELSRLLDDEEKPVVLVLGAPQVGKTNFVCNTVEERIGAGHPCLFFSAVSLTNGFFHEIAEDFGWMMGRDFSAHEIIHKIQRILNRIGKRLTVFVDGWNETNEALAQLIDRDSERLQSKTIQLVVSLTNVAAERLFHRSAGNPSFLAESASIYPASYRLVALQSEGSFDPKKHGWSIVRVNKYTQDEQTLAYAKYARAYAVQVPLSHEKTVDPYMLGIAMRLAQGKALPSVLDEPSLTEQIICGKIARAIGMAQVDIHACLTALADCMFVQDSPLMREQVAKAWGARTSEKIPAGFFEAAMLLSTNDEGSSTAVDFYYEKERDFVVSHWARRWPEKIQAGIDLTADFELAVSTRVGTSSLRWFFKQLPYVEMFEPQDGELPNFRNLQVRRILLESLCEVASSFPEAAKRWRRSAVSVAIGDEDNTARISAVQFVALVSDDLDDLIDEMSGKYSLEDFLRPILSIRDDYPLTSASPSYILASSLMHMHLTSNDEENESDITDVLSQFLKDESPGVREYASILYGELSPLSFLNTLKDMLDELGIQAEWLAVRDFSDGVWMAVERLEDLYCGAMCPSPLDSMEDEELLSEYGKLYSAVAPIIEIAPPFMSKKLTDLLGIVLPAHFKPDLQTGGVLHVDMYTFPLPFVSDAVTDKP